MSMSKRRKSALSFESLESKQMLAGDVMVNVEDGNLAIFGDAESNQIAISSGEQPGVYIIRGLDGTTITSPDGEGTTTSGLLRVEGVDGNVNIRMGEGDDTVNINDAQFAGNVNIGTGAGEDTVRVGVRPDGPPPGPGDEPTVTVDGENPEPELPLIEPDVAIRGRLRIGTGSENDTVAVDNTNIGRNLAVSSGEGNDIVRVGQPDGPIDGPADGPIDEPLPPAEEVAATPSQDQTPNTAQVRVRGATHIHLGAGEDALNVNDLNTRLLHVNGGADSDRIVISDTRAGLVNIHGGRGEASDTIRVNQTNARVLGIRTGAGDDSVRVTDSAFSLIAAGLGAGNDTLALGGVKARAAFLFGGAGDEDLYRDLGENMIRNQVVRGFELPPTEEPAPPVEQEAVV